MFGVLVTSKPSVDGITRNSVVANLNGKVKAYSRLTDGKQGRGNQWLEIDVPSFNVDDEVQVGDIVAVPVTSGDLNDFEATGTPSVLLQKLVNAHTRRGKFGESNQNIKLLIDSLFELASSNVDALADYFLDNRGRKGKSEVRSVSIQSNESEEVSSMPQHLFIPSWDKYKNHIERIHAGNVGEFEMLEFALKQKMNVFALGDAGTGKTELAYWFASKTKRNLAVVQANGMTTVDDLLGTYVVNPATGKLVYQASAVADVVANGGVLLIDEIFKLPRTVQSVLHSLLDDRRCLFLTNKFGATRIDAHDDLIIIAGGNPNYKGDSALNEAFFDRFAIKVKYDYDKRIEAKIVKSDSLRDLANKMRSMSQFETFASSDVAFETPISPRLLKSFETIAVGLNFDFAVDVFVNNFAPEEQSAVRTLMDSHAFNIQEQLGLATASPVSTEE